jgi:uncharacterized protein YbjT (DUF2867 family)
MARVAVTGSSGKLGRAVVGHLNIHAGGGRDVPLATRRERVDAEVRRLTELGATAVRVLQEDGLDHYGVAMTDPKATSSMSTDVQGVLLTT